jgi:hypothetical protein
VTGGAGAGGSFFHCNGYDGGIGLTLDTNGAARILDSTIVGGAGGAPFGGCAPGVAGEAIVTLAAGPPTSVAGAARAFDVTSPVREGGAVLATFRGVPGDLVWLAFSTQPARGSSFRALDGELLVASPRVLFMGAVPASGTLSVSTSAPALGAGAEAAVFFGQGIFRDALTGRFVAGTPSGFVLLASTL